MSYESSSPFSQLVLHPEIRTGHDFFQIPSRPDLVIRGHEAFPDMHDSFEEAINQRDVLAHIAAKYGITNSGFMPVYGENFMYVVTKRINSPNLETLLETPDSEVLQIADSLVDRLTTYTENLLDKDETRAGDIFGFSQYAVENAEAVLVDVGIAVFEANWFRVDDEESLYHLIACQVGPLAMMAAELKKRDVHNHTSGRVVELINSLKGNTSEQQQILELIAKYTELGEPERIEAEGLIDL